MLFCVACGNGRFDVFWHQTMAYAPGGKDYTIEISGMVSAVQDKEILYTRRADIRNNHWHYWPLPLTGTIYFLRGLLPRSPHHQYLSFRRGISPVARQSSPEDLVLA
mgnify:CR=1 FL=1